MEIKSLLLLLVVGVVVVAAKKGSSEEDDRLGPYGPWDNQRPFGRAPFKLRNPKHQIRFPFPPRPVFPGNRPILPQQPQQSQEMQGAQQLTPYDPNFIENLKTTMAQVSENVYAGFQSVDAEIERNKKSVESALLSQFQSIQSMLIAKKAKEIQDAVKEGKDQMKMESCMKDQEEIFKVEIDMDIRRTADCLNDVTSRARQTLTGARNLYTEKSAMNAYQVKEIVYQMNTCVSQGDNFCAYEKMAAINQRVKVTVEEGYKQLEKIQDAPRQQMIQYTYCRQNFVQDLRSLRAEYNNIMRRCIMSVEVSKLPAVVPEGPVQVPEVPAVQVPNVPVQVPEVPVLEVSNKPEKPEVVSLLPSVELGAEVNLNNNA